jgi:hypothetical protein
MAFRLRCWTWREPWPAPLYLSGNSTPWPGWRQEGYPIATNNDAGRLPAPSQQTMMLQADLFRISSLDLASPDLDHIALFVDGGCRSIAAIATTGECRSMQPGRCRSTRSMSVNQVDADQTGRCQSTRSMSVNQVDADQPGRCQSTRSMSINQVDVSQPGRCQSTRSMPVNQVDASQPGRCQSTRSMPINQATAKLGLYVQPIS